MKLWNRKTKNPASEAKSLAAPDEVILEIFGAQPTTGAGISDAEALSVPAVSCSVRLISEAAASLRLKVMSIGDDGTENEDKSHPVSRIIQGDVNGWTSGFELIRDLTAQALTSNSGGLAYVNRPGERIAEIIHYETGNLTVEYSTEGTKEPLYRLGNRPLDAKDVIHVRGPFSRSALSMAKDAIAVTKQMETHAGNLFKSGAKPGGVIEIPGKLGEEAFKKMAAAWRAAHEGGANAGKTAILWDGATFKQVTLNSVDAQFLELRTFQNIEIARAFRVPPSMLYELDRATWSNSEQMGKEFLTYTLEPWLRALESGLSRALFTEAERGSWKIVFERDDLTRADLGSRATAYSSLIASRVLNPNEARQWEGMPAYEGGETFVNPNISVSEAA